MAGAAPRHLSLLQGRIRGSVGPGPTQLVYDSQHWTPRPVLRTALLKVPQWGKSSKLTRGCRRIRNREPQPFQEELRGSGVGVWRESKHKAHVRGGNWAGSDCLRGPNAPEGRVPPPGAASRAPPAAASGLPRDSYLLGAARAEGRPAQPAPPAKGTQTSLPWAELYVTSVNRRHPSSGSTALAGRVIFFSRPRRRGL